MMNKDIVNSDLSLVIMAAGKGTRMNSDIPKVMHEISGDNLLNHVIRTSQQLNPINIVVIVGHQAELVKQSVYCDDILFSLQQEQHGTGHAVLQAKEHLENFIGNTLVLSGDVPLIQTPTLSALIEKQARGRYSACMLTADLGNPDGYGRVLRDSGGNLKEVKEQKDCAEKELKIREINTGIYIFNNKKLFDLLPLLSNNNAQSEYYLPDVLSLMIKHGGKIGLEKTNNIVEIQGVNTLEQLSYLENIFEENN